jgi:hypothetical protein
MKRAVGWIAALGVTTIIFGTVYVVAQQLDRSAANDAPLRLASQVVAELRSGQSGTVAAQPHVDLSRSLATFVVVEDAQGRATSGSGYLANTLVSLPTGVLAHAAQSGRDDVTWQPTKTLRFATVTLKSGDGFVSAGQSLAPSESRSTNFATIVGLAWLVSILMIGAALFLSVRLRRRPNQPIAATD